MTIGVFVEPRADGQWRIELREGRGLSLGVLVVPERLKGEVMRRLGAGALQPESEPSCICGVSEEPGHLWADRECRAHGPWRQLPPKPEPGEPFPVGMANEPNRVDHPYMVEAAEPPPAVGGIGVAGVATDRSKRFDHGTYEPAPERGASSRPAILAPSPEVLNPWCSACIGRGGWYDGVGNWQLCGACGGRGFDDAGAWDGIVP